MDYIIGFLIVLEALVCILLVLIVLMQRPRQEGLGAAFGSGMMDSLAGAQTTNVLQKGTTYLGIGLFLLTFLLATLVAHNTEKQKDSFVEPTDKPLPAVPAPPAAPAPTATPVPAPSTPAPAASTPAPAATAPAPAAPAPKPEEAKPVEPKPSEAKPAPAVPSNVVPVPTAPPTPPPAPGSKPEGGN